ncbi:alpha-1,2-fucosyltransferase [Planktomarina sp.]|nr:alpha-1,2-fucosyltransferase [Planktomarina sp.]
MIIVKIKGGLGNQLFQYAVGRSTSLSLRVPLLLDISMYNTYTLHEYRLGNLKIEAGIATNSEVAKFRGGESLPSRIFRKNKFFRKSSFRPERHNFYYDPNLVSGDNIYLDGYWQNELYFSDIRQTLLQEIAPKCELTPTAQLYAKKIKNSRNSVSIHVRRGDYLEVSGIGVLDKDYFYKAANILCDQYDNLTFYVFSNDIPWCKKYLNSIPNVTFIENTENEVQDLFLMSLCNHNIIANSTFSWWGAWLNQFRNKCVIAPKGWRLDIDGSDKIIPKDWIIIK